MLGLAAGLAQALSAAHAHEEERKRFYEMCDSLPEDQAKELIKLRGEAEKEDRDHQKKLEIAREGRSLNFWGNR